MKKSILSYLIFLLLVAYLLFFKGATWILYFPVIISLAFLVLFAGSYLQDRCYVEKIAYAIDPHLPPEGRIYCRRVNFVWCVFFVFNAAIAFWTAQYSLKYWTIYNCFISYIIMGLIFAIEYCVRRRFIKKVKMKDILLLLMFIQPLCIIANVKAQTKIESVDVFENKESSLEEIQEFSKKFQNIDSLRSKFVQTKVISGLSKPIISNGRFIFSRKQGIYWEIEKPLAAAFIISEKGLLKRSSGESSTFVPATEDRFVLGFTKVFLGMFKADFTDLIKIFSVHYQHLSAGHWQVGLDARSPQTSKIISKIILYGNTFIDQIAIFDANNDRTDIVFEAPSASPVELTTEEIKLFDANE